MKTIKFSFLLSLSILLFACSGSDDTPEEQPTVNLRLIEIEFDYVDGSIQDESWEYFYNAEGQLTQHLLHTQPQNASNYQYTYENGRLISTKIDISNNGEVKRLFNYNNGKITTVTDSLSGYLLHYFEFFYDNLGRLQKQTRTGGGLDCIQEYFYTGDNPLIVHNSYDCNEDTLDRSYVYDDKRNPIYEAYPPEYNLAYGFMPFNVTEMIWDGSSNPYAIYTMEYTYNSSGLPIKRVFYENGDQTRTDTFTYEEF